MRKAWIVGGRARPHPPELRPVRSRPGPWWQTDAMRRLALGMLALVLLLTGCAGEGDDPAGAPSPTAPAIDEPTPPADGDADERAPDDDEEWVRCEDEGFSLEHPASWHTQSADGSEGCSQLHPEPVAAPGATDERSSAITAYVDSVPFHEVAGPDPDRAADRAETTIDGLQAVRLAYETGDEALHPAGTPITPDVVARYEGGGGGFSVTGACPR